MRKKIDWTKYYVRQDLGFTKHYVQNGLEYDEDGLSLRDFPTPEEEDQKEAHTLSKMKLQPETYIFSGKSQKPFATMLVAKAVAARKKLDMEKVKFLQFKRGVVIQHGESNQSK